MTKAITRKAFDSVATPYMLMALMDNGVVCETRPPNIYPHWYLGDRDLGTSDREALWALIQDGTIVAGKRENAQ